MKRTLLTPPAAEPVDLVEVKQHLRVDLDDDDALITALIVVAREQVEYLTGQRLLTQTWEIELAAGESASLWGLVPLRSLASTLPTNATVDGNWPPTVSVTAPDTLTVVCGFGAAMDVPRSVRQWMLLRIGALYEQRESFLTGSGVPAVPHGFADALLDPYCLPRC